MDGSNKSLEEGVSAIGVSSDRPALWSALMIYFSIVIVMDPLEL